MDQKSSRVFVRSVVEHLKKSLRSFDDTHPELLVADIEDHLKMIKMASSMYPCPKKKKGKKKMKKKSTPADASVVAPVDDTVSK